MGVARLDWCRVGGACLSVEAHVGGGEVVQQ